MHQNLNASKLITWSNKIRSLVKFWVYRNSWNITVVIGPLSATEASHQKGAWPEVASWVEELFFSAGWIFICWMLNCKEIFWFRFLYLQMFLVLSPITWFMKSRFHNTFCSFMLGLKRWPHDPRRHALMLQHQPSHKRHLTVTDCKVELFNKIKMSFNFKQM